jgi:hypothetical protein
VLQLKIILIVISLTVALYFVVLWHELGVSICDPSFSVELYEWSVGFEGGDIFKPFGGMSFFF